MKNKLLLFVSSILLLIYSCVKSLDVKKITLHSGKILAKTCPFEAFTTEVAVQLDNKDPLSFEWTNPQNDSVYENVIVTFNATLIQSIGKSLTYSSVRKPTSKDTAVDIVPQICNNYSIAYLDSITVK